VVWDVEICLLGRGRVERDVEGGTEVAEALQKVEAYLVK
jgi:hypothetical protein